jgi:hypothetical protein
MSEENAVVETKKSKQSFNLDIDQLQQIVTAAVVAASQASAQTVAAAVVEAKKPVPDPRQEASDAQMRESTRINKELQEEAMRLAQEACPHRQGSNQLSSFQGPLSSFVLHILDTNLAVAICTNCLKVIFSDTTDPEDRKLLREKSGNQPSSAGRRYFRDPEKAMKAGR